MLQRLDLHVSGNVRIMPPPWSALAIANVAEPPPDALDERHWRDDAFDFWAFDRKLDELAGAGEPLAASASPERGAAVVAEILTRAQRLAPRRNAFSRRTWFDVLLAEHRALHACDKPLVLADLDHALDTWQWTLRLDPYAVAAVQIAALVHDIERLASEADERVEQHAPSYQAFKDAHAHAGAAMAARLLERAGVPDEVGRTAVQLVAAHETPAGDRDAQLVADADALSFFAFNSPGYLAYFGPAQTARKVAYTLGRMSARARREVARLRLLAPIRAQIER